MISSTLLHSLAPDSSARFPVAISVSIESEPAGSVVDYSTSNVIAKVARACIWVLMAGDDRFSGVEYCR